MSTKLSSEVTAGYKKLYVLYFGRLAIIEPGLSPGKVSLLIHDKPGFSAQGTLSASGALSGMARAYNELNIQVGDIVECEVTSANQVLVTGVMRGAPYVVETPRTSDSTAVAAESVFQRQRLKSIHIELFSPENLNRWEPENEPDIYMAFGVLQEYTRFRYCCATSRQLLDKLGFKADTKPDAILVNDGTSEYVVAEFKMQSSSFDGNHKPSDVDVLIVWDDDERDRSKLPPDVLCLREIAREAAQEIIKGS